MELIRIAGHPLVGGDAAASADPVAAICRTVPFEADAPLREQDGVAQIPGQDPATAFDEFLDVARQGWIAGDTFREVWGVCRALEWWADTPRRRAHALWRLGQSVDRMTGSAAARADLKRALVTRAVAHDPDFAPARLAHAKTQLAAAHTPDAWSRALAALHGARGPAFARPIADPLFCYRRGLLWLELGLVHYAAADLALGRAMARTPLDHAVLADLESYLAIAQGDDAQAARAARRACEGLVVYGADRVPRGGQRAICAAAVRAIRRDDTDTERILPLLAHVTPADFTTHENIWAAQFLTTHLDTPRALPFIHAVFDAELNHHEFAQLIALLAHVDPIQLTTAELLTRLDHLTPRTPDGPDDTPLYHEALTRLMREDFDPEDIAAVIRQAAKAGVPISADHKVAIEDTITALHALSEREWNRTAARGLVAAMIATARAAQTLFPNHHEFLRLQARGHLAIERLLDHDGAKQHGTQGENLRQAVDIMTSLRQRFEGPLEALPRKILITYGLAHKEYSRYLTDNHERERGITSRARNRLHQQAVDATTLAHEKFLDDPEAWLNWGWVRYDEAKKDVVGYEASVVRAESVFDAVERLFRAGHASPVQYAEAHRLYIWTVNETADILIRGEDYETAINQYLHRRDIPTMVLRAQQYVAGAQWGLDWLYGWWRYLYLMGKALSRNRVYWVAEDYGQPDPLATGKVAGLTKRYADFGHAAVGATDYFQAALCILNGPTKILTRSTTAPTAATHAMAQIVNQACDPAHQLPTIRDLDYIRGRPDLYTGSTLGKLGLLAGARQALYSALDTISDEHSQWRNYTRDILVEVNTNLVSVHFPPNHCELSAEILYLLPQLENLYGSAPYRRRLQGAQRVHKALACQQRPALIGTREIQ